MFARFASLPAVSMTWMGLTGGLGNAMHH
jgi:hypothetical protein